MESVDPLPDFSLEASISRFTDLSEASYLIETDTALLESRYQHLVRERDELRHKYERERRERESLEVKLHQEFDQKLHIEEKLSELSRNLSGYETELQTLRHENSHLKTQFAQLRSAVQTRMSSSVISLHGGIRGTSLAGAGFAGHSTAGVGGSGASLSGAGGATFIMSSSSDTSVSLNTETYKQDVALLAQENELFKQIIDIIDKQELGKVVLEERASVQSNKISFESEEITRLEREKSRLEERVRDSERSVRDHERFVEEIQSKAEEDVRKFKRECRFLENELQSKSSVVEEYEIQLGQLKQAYEDEIHQMEMKFEMELTSNKQLTEQIHLLETSIRTLEEERKEMLVKIEDVYKTESQVFEERSVLEESYSRDINELQRKLEEEIQRKNELSMELERLVAELVESEKQKKDMEARFFYEAQEMKVQFDTEKEQIIGYFNSTNMSHMYTQSAVPQPTSSTTQTARKEGDGNRRLEEEIRRREKLEEENKKLLYHINDVLEQSARGAGPSNERGYKYEYNETSHLANITRPRDFESEIDELREKCQTLERNAKRQKELEAKNRDLLEEIEELTTKRDDMARKQKDLMKELDNSLSSLQQVEDKNRRLIEEVKDLSRKIRQMEETFRNEKDDWIRNCGKDKASQINDISNEKEAFVRKYNEQVKENRKLENEISSLERRFSEAESGRQRIEREKSEMTSHFTEEILFERNRNKLLKDELEKSAETFQKKTEQLEASSYERKKKYEEEIRTLEEEKQRFRKELENETETYRSRFEEERKVMERRITEIEERLRQRNTENVTSVMESNSVLHSTHATSDFQRKIDSLNNEKAVLEEMLRDMERMHSRKIDDLKYECEQDTRRQIAEKENEFRQKLREVKDKHEKQVDQLRRRYDIATKGSDDTVTGFNTEGGSFVEMDDKLRPSIHNLLKEQKQHMDELRKQIKLQREAFENEKGNLRNELQGDMKELVRSKENEKKVLQQTIHKLTEELRKLKHEKESLIITIRKERGNSNSRMTEHSNSLTSLREDCENRVRKERQESQKTIIELRRKLGSTENRIKEIEEKHRKDIHQMEIEFEFNKTELKQTTAVVERQIRENFELEYTAALSKQKEKYEETLQGLRKEIQSLQEQRKQIQEKLSNQGALSIYKVLLEKGVASNREVYFKSDSESELRFWRETKQMEDKILDLERETEILKKEKADIKSSYKQEKVQLRAEFDRERDNLEQTYRRQIEDLKRNLQAVKVQLESTMVTTKEDHQLVTSRHSAIGLVNDSNAAIKAKANDLESQMGILKDKLHDLEERQKRALVSKARKNTSVRFSSSSIDRSRDNSSSRLFSAMDLQSSVHQRGGLLERSRSVDEVQGAARGRAYRRLANQIDFRPHMQRLWAPNDQILSSGARNTRSFSSALGRQIQSSFLSPSFAFHGRSLGGYEGSRMNGFLQARSFFRSDQDYLPSAGILGGAPLASSGRLGTSLTGGYGGSMYSGSGGFLSGLEIQHMRPVATAFVPDLVTGVGLTPRLYQSTSLQNASTQRAFQGLSGSVMSSTLQTSSESSEARQSGLNPSLQSGAGDPTTNAAEDAKSQQHLGSEAQASISGCALQPTVQLQKKQVEGSEYMEPEEEENYPDYDSALQEDPKNLPPEEQSNEG